MKAITPMLTSLLKWSAKLIFSSAYSIFLSILLGLIGIPLVIAWATGTLNTIIETIQSPTPLWATISLTLLCCLYVYLKTQSYSPRTRRVKLSKTAKDILVFFGQQHETQFMATQLSKTFKITFNQAQFAMDELHLHKFLYAESQYELGRRKYWLSPAGREYLGKRNLL